MRLAKRRAGWALAAAGTFGMAVATAAQFTHDKQPAPPPPVRKAAPAVSPAEARLAEIKVELAWLTDPDTFPAQLAVRHVSGSLEIGGLVHGQKLREKAVQLAREQTKLDVVDKLIVLPGAQPALARDTDARLCQKAAMAASKALANQVEGFEISADAVGQITVSGLVASCEEKLNVSRHLSEVPGCTSVLNQLIVKPVLHGNKPFTTVTADGKLELLGEPIILLPNIVPPQVVIEQVMPAPTPAPAGSPAPVFQAPAPAANALPAPAVQAPLPIAMAPTMPPMPAATPVSAAPISVVQAPDPKAMPTPQPVVTVVAAKPRTSPPQPRQVVPVTPKARDTKPVLTAVALPPRPQSPYAGGTQLALGSNKVVQAIPSQSPYAGTPAQAKGAVQASASLLDATTIKSPYAKQIAVASLPATATQKPKAAPTIVQVSAVEEVPPAPKPAPVLAPIPLKPAIPAPPPLSPQAMAHIKKKIEVQCGSAAREVSVTSQPDGTVSVRVQVRKAADVERLSPKIITLDELDAYKDHFLDLQMEVK